MSFVLILPLIFFLFSCGVRKSIHYLPDINQYSLDIPKINIINDSTFSYAQNYLTKNKQQLWELYIQGNPLQLGYNNGALTQNLMRRQEEIFFSKVESFVPSKFKQKILGKFLKWYNRKMYLNVRDEYQVELYGLSQYSSEKYDFIAPRYLRNLYLHGAHDIGHALQDLAIVGCTSLAVWDANSEDGDLLIGRNFDFYVNDEFAKNKLVEFVEPNEGIPYISVSWPGMIGVVSGMNKEGVTVTINAGKSKIPLAAKTPVSLVTREILQYATNIDEAIAIAKKSKVFVSESILIGSAHDRNAVIIEISPNNFGLYHAKNSSKIFSTNHFQSEAYKNDKINQKHILESHSEYRYKKLGELLEEYKELSPEKMAAILRDQSGLNHRRIGYGNEKAINQLQAHHSIIFSPEKKLVWVSSSPYQLGEYVCYDLNIIFSEKRLQNGEFATSSMNIAQDPFIDSQEFKDYKECKEKMREVEKATSTKDQFLSDQYLNHFKALNADFWKVYFETGKYYYSKKEYQKSKIEFEKALTKEITTTQDKNTIKKHLNKTLKKVKLKK
ncbi:acyl-CoA--6-aminopenicillanic acid acyl-transferase [Chryseobacterium nematophagum]|uniref:Acyl-CoA--6-aminopenicillanic acid acyl-transferase n=1 Tax=Chryseobacterium nematophagum TaxID=2305228 RepID=A0A3M7LEP7_9FLAO|nr:C45 family peptidase [Chryseobacterium nematophagum]RMZ61193.1 acyl-CoA--6-aminopenicillanic acid acyl-transferase [Chryseobacterium nematophagum]